MVKRGTKIQSKGAPKGSVKLEDYLKHRGWRRWIIRLGWVGVLGVLIVVDHQGWLLYRGGDWQRYEGLWARVVKVVDGDTLELAVGDGESQVTRVRLWGVDTPELGRLGSGRANQPYALEASEYARGKAQGQRIRVRLERHQTRGKYGRLLAYVQLPDGSYLNEVLLVAGLAKSDDRFSHRWVERYELLEQQARYDKVGLWGQAGD